MSDNENIKKTTQNKLWTIFSSIFKSIIVLLIIGFIMCALSAWGVEEYTKDSLYRYGGWGNHEELNPIYGVVGIIIYIAINYFSFLLYNYITNRFKNYKATLGKIIYIIFSIFINILMQIMYSNLFDSYYFENNLLEILNEIVIKFGRVTFPIMFVIIYTYNI